MSNRLKGIIEKNHKNGFFFEQMKGRKNNGRGYESAYMENRKQKISI